MSRNATPRACDALLTDQTAYQEADYLRDYQKHNQHRELLAAQVFDYGALHLARSRAPLRLTVYRNDSAVTFEGFPALTDVETHTERNDA